MDTTQAKLTPQNLPNTSNTAAKYTPTPQEREQAETAIQQVAQNGVFTLTPKEAFTQGLNVRKALKIDPVNTRLAILNLIGGLCRFVDAKRTITTDEDLIFTVEALIEGYPALTLQELRLIIDGMKRGQYGKYYERLKLPEIEAAIQQYEGTTKAQVLERIHVYKDVTRGVDDVSRIKHEPQTLADVRRKEWFKKFYPTNGGRE